MSIRTFLTNSLTRREKEVTAVVVAGMMAVSLWHGIDSANQGRDAAIASAHQATQAARTVAANDISQRQATVERINGLEAALASIHAELDLVLTASTAAERQSIVHAYASPSTATTAPPRAQSGSSPAPTPAPTPSPTPAPAPHPTPQPCPVSILGHCL